LAIGGIVMVSRSGKGVSSLLVAVGLVLALCAGPVRSALAVVPVVAGGFASLSPSRILDTRLSGGKLAAGESRTLQVTGIAGVPVSGVSAVVLNVTVTETTAGGYLTVSPTGTSRPTVSNLNWSAGATIPNAVTVKVGTGGQVDLFQSGPGTAQVVVDVAGYYADGIVVDPGGFTALTPARILDTRTTGGMLYAGASRDLQITGAGGVPSSNVSAVVLNVTVTETSAGGYLSVFPTGSSKPTASNLNWSAGLTIPNLVIVRVGDGGKVSLFNSGPGTAQVIVDVAGFFLAGDVSSPGMFVALSPSRILDTRSSGSVAAGTDVSVAVVGRGVVPSSGVSAAVMNTTVTETGAGGFLTAYPGTGSLPTASNLNWSAGATIPNLVTVQVGSDGSVKFRNGSPGSTQVIVDIAGYYLAPSSVPAPAISAVSPVTGPSTGGVLVTIWGTNFTDVAAVTFDGTPGSGLTVVSPSQLTVVSPGHRAGTVDVTVATPGGTATSTGGFSYFAVPPTISGLSPVTGPSTGGVLVTIWGTNFTDVAAVTFDGTPGSALTVMSPSQLTVVTPAHSAGTADVSVFTSGGTATTPAGFTYVAAPPPPPPPPPPPAPGSYVANPVTSGAYCAQNVAGWYGYTVNGVLMQCKTSATDTRLRWRAV
jgi:IPT/TIG domain